MMKLGHFYEMTHEYDSYAVQQPLDMTLNKPEKYSKRSPDEPWSMTHNV